MNKVRYIVFHLRIQNPHFLDILKKRDQIRKEEEEEEEEEE